MGTALFRIRRNRKKIVFIFLIGSVSSFGAFAQKNKVKPGKDYFEAESSSVLADHVNDSTLKTVLAFKTGSELNSAAIRLNSQETIDIRFDDLKAGFARFQFSIVHCNADWTASELFTTDYLDGMPTDNFQNQLNSFNTLLKYTHYYLQLPNSSVRFKRSGNYAIKVFKADSPDNILFIKRFMVYEDLAFTDVIIRQPTRVEFRPFKQEVDFNIQTNIPIADAYRELTVVVRQNERWDNSITHLKPLFINGNTLTYDYDLDNLFDGGNEFRQMDIRSSRLHGIGVRHIEQGKSINITLNDDEITAHKRYQFFRDANGKFVHQTVDGRISFNELDYVSVKFSLTKSEPFEKDNLYVFGQLTNWEVLPEFKMKWNVENRKYECSAIIKQGFYNYAYVTSNGKLNDFTFTEGQHVETENIYELLVYFKPLGQLADRLILYKKINSLDITR